MLTQYRTVGGKRESECSGKVEIRTRKNVLAVGEASIAIYIYIFSPTQGLLGSIVVNLGSQEKGS